MEPSKNFLGQKPARKMNPWLLWCPLLGGIAMIALLVFLMMSHKVTVARLIHFVSAAAITFPLVYFFLSPFQKPGGIGHAIVVVFSTVFLFGVFYVIIGASFVVPFTGYNTRHFRNQLETDLRNSYNHANEYLSEHPQERIHREEQLRSKGWKPSSEVSFESANLTIKGGWIVLKHKLLTDSTVGLKPGEGRVRTDGDDIKVEIPGKQ